MKANEFFRKYGWSRVKHCTKPTSRDNFFIVSGEVIRDQDLIDLKRLVESHELVGRYGTVEEAKEYLPMLRMDSYDELKQAILDVESCQ